MPHNLDDLARLVKLYRVNLAYSQRGYAVLAFKHPALPEHIRMAIRNRRRGLARLMQAGDVRVCPSPDMHRASWFYAGRGRYICEVCRRIDTQMCLWRAC